MTPEPVFTPLHFELADGTVTTIRTVHLDDAPRLQAFVSRLSPESIYFRFLTTLKGLSDAEAAHLVDLDYADRMALAATITLDADELVIAVARYARQVAAPDRAECAIVVEDRYQGQGLARFLIKQLAHYARQHGIRTFTGTINGSNQRMKHFLQNTGLPTRLVAGSHGELEVEVDAMPHD
jgi:GNAT superfamily N-acetyltransferase